jgi:phosphonate transport system substrate-binding protein
MAGWRTLIRGPLLVGAALLAGAGAAQAETALVFGVYASDKPSAMVEQLRPTLDLLEGAMSKRLGEAVTIKLRVARDYQTGLADLVTRKVDFARLGPASYVEAKEQAAGVQVLAAERLNGSKIFRGVICVNTASDIQALSELAGRTFAFGDEQSTIGRYTAQLILARAGITAASLKGFKYLERHDRVGAAVAAGQFDAGALEGTMFDQMVAAGAPLRLLVDFPNVTKPWVGRVGLAAPVAEAIRRSLLEIRDPVALAALRFEGFEAAENDDYEVTRASIKDNWRFFRAPGAP